IYTNWRFNLIRTGAMTVTTVIEMLEEIGALLKNDHFVYSSGKHGDVYINKNDLFAYTRTMEAAGKLLAEKYQAMEIDSVAGPVMCGIIPAHWVAYHLSNFKNREIFGVFAERNADKLFEFMRGYEKFISGKKVLLVDDIATSGSTLKKFIQTIKEAGGTVA